MNIFKRIGRGLKRVLKSPVGKVVAVAAAAYIGAPAVRSAVESLRNGGGLAEALDAFGDTAMEQFEKVGSAVGIGSDDKPTLVTDVDGGGLESPDATKPTSAQRWARDPATGLNIMEGEREAAKSYGGGGGFMDRTLNFLSTPGGGAVGSAALKLAAGAMTPNETAMRINAEDQWKKEEEERRLRNTGVGGVNINIPITSPHARLPVPPPPLKPAGV